MNFIRSKLRIASLLMILAFLGISLGVVFHSHKAEAKGADHCSVCQVGQQVRSGCISSQTGFSVSFFFQEILASSVSSEEVAPIPLVKHSQAPPLA